MKSSEPVDCLSFFRYQPEYRKKVSGVMSMRSALLLEFSKVKFGSLHEGVEFSIKSPLRF